MYRNEIRRNLEQYHQWRGLSKRCKDKQTVVSYPSHRKSCHLQGRLHQPIPARRERKLTGNRELELEVPSDRRRTKIQRKVEETFSRHSQWFLKKRLLLILLIILVHEISKLSHVSSEINHLVQAYQQWGSWLRNRKLPWKRRRGESVALQRIGKLLQG